MSQPAGPSASENIAEWPHCGNAPGDSEARYGGIQVTGVVPRLRPGALAGCQCTHPPKPRRRPSPRSVLKVPEGLAETHWQQLVPWLARGVQLEVSDSGPVTESHSQADTWCSVLRRSLSLETSESAASKYAASV
eukprot:CAMPEP_0202832530 /NCGR_PEP_ID=MMETSP1389-20130828/19215_1 /ASSEMBLY_ACC=CAM_ASM_000865 /TAXON_ID=302021 /ORGANISM="Rhodomonas sp., Strain CCMP768" /LENGTH=134 /DNA_ID=CAMNT_0049506543 /DNA_START=115 /DNA_END=520 /DNA_ORIENTATION=-